MDCDSSVNKMIGHVLDDQSLDPCMGVIYFYIFCMLISLPAYTQGELYLYGELVHKYLIASFS
jgi:hypothetical protein